IDLLTSGTEFFPALKAEIEGARREIYLETYIFESDRTGRDIAESLVRAARRGAAVHVLMDGFGSQNFDSALAERMVREGVRLLVYRRHVPFWNFRRNRLRRLHRKLAVVDARVGFAGGINL